MPATAKVAAEVFRKSRREGLIGQRYEITLGSQAQFAMLLGQMKPTATTMLLPVERTHAWWLWPNMLSLDAPFIALVWQELWAHCLAVEIPWMHRVLLALATWLAYSGDRLLDARRLKGPTDSARHEFSHKYYSLLTRAWFVVLISVIALGLQLSLWEIINGLLLLLVVGGYFILHHAKDARALVGPAKEIMAGTIYSVGTVFFVVLGISFTPALLLALVSWAGLCVMNCLAIACWDRQRDKVMEQHSLAQLWTHADRWLWLWAASVSILAVCAWSMDSRLGPVAAALLLSALALSELTRAKGNDLRRVLADVVLLTPIMLFLF